MLLHLIETLVIALHSDRVKFLTVFFGGARIIVSKETVGINELNRSDYRNLL